MKHAIEEANAELANLQVCFFFHLDVPEIFFINFSFESKGCGEEVCEGGKKRT